jgi:hypothetical protein
VTHDACFGCAAAAHAALETTSLARFVDHDDAPWNRPGLMPQQIARHATGLAARGGVIRQLQAELVLDANASFDVQEIDGHAGITVVSHNGSSDRPVWSMKG